MNADDADSPSTINHEPSTTPSDGFAPVIPSQLSPSPDPRLPASSLIAIKDADQRSDARGQEADATDVDLVFALLVKPSDGEVGFESLYPTAFTPAEWDDAPNLTPDPYSVTGSLAHASIIGHEPSAVTPPPHPPIPPSESNPYAGPFIVLTPPDAPSQTRTAAFQSLAAETLDALIPQAASNPDATQVSTPATDHPRPTTTPASPGNPERITDNPASVTSEPTTKKTSSSAPEPTNESLSSHTSGLTLSAELSIGIPIEGTDGTLRHLDMAEGYDVDPSGIKPDWFGIHLLYEPEGHAESSVDWSVERISWGGRMTNMRSNEWIVQLGREAVAAATSVSDAAELLTPGEDVNLEFVRGLGMEGQLLVHASSQETGSVERWLSTDPAVAYFEPNMVLSSLRIPIDPDFPDLWAMDNIGQTGGTPDADIDATDAWQIATGSSRIVVGVIDSGVDYTHPDLAANIWTNPGEIAGNGIDDDRNGFVDDVHGYDFANNDANPMDDLGHGTHVAGTIGAVGNNGVGVSGVNWTSSIMAIKWIDAQDRGALADAVRAANYATMMRTTYQVDVRVTNNSWRNPEGFSQALRDAIAASGTAGMLFVAAAGNFASDNDTTPLYPASYSLGNVISVAATDDHDNLASFSNFGLTSVDLAAPGEDILSTTWPGSLYGYMSGTSMAAPHVSGVAALAWSLYPESTASAVRQALLAGVDTITGLAGRVATGGRLNARGTLDALGGSISGTKWHDLDSDGVRDTGEPGLRDWTIYLDENPMDGRFNPGERSAITDANGHFAITGLAPDVYVLREESQPGWEVTSPMDPAPGAYVVLIRLGDPPVTGKDFGNKALPGRISGSKWHDLDGDRNWDSGEPGLANWKIYIDRDNDNQWDSGEPYRWTDSNGNYEFESLTPGTYTIREVQQTAWDQTAPDSGFYRVTLAPAGNVSGLDFGNRQQRGEIHGSKWNDLDADGVWDAGEPGLAGWTIYLDLNGNGRLDSGDPSAATEGDGHYGFLDLAPRNYVVREEVKEGWAQKAPSSGFYSVDLDPGEEVRDRNFGNWELPGEIYGSKWNDLDRDGVWDTGEPGLAGWTIYLDANNNGVPEGGESSAVTDSNGDYSFTNLRPKPYVVREVLQTGWAQTAPDSGYHTVTVPAGKAVRDIDFGNYELPVEIHGSKWRDLDGDGIWDTGEPGVEDWRIYLDTNNNGRRDTGEATATTDINGDYAFTDIPKGTYVVREVVDLGWKQTAPSSGFHSVTLRPGEVANNKDFGNKWTAKAGGWVEFGDQSAENGGISRNPSNSRNPAMVIWDGKPVVAWEDDGGGDWEIYVKQWDRTANGGVGGWVELGTGAASGRGVSKRDGLSFGPSLALDENGNPIVAWYDNMNNAQGIGNWEILARRWNGTAWGAEENISNNALASLAPSLLQGASGRPIVAWQDSDPVGGDAEIYIKQWDGDSWEPLGTGAASGVGISDNRGESWGPATTLWNGQPVVAWYDTSGGDSEIYVKRWDPSANAGLGQWVELGTDSAKSGGISVNNAESRNPSIALDADGNPVVAWEDKTGGDWEIYVKHWDGNANGGLGGWVEMGTGSASNGGISNNTGESVNASLVGRSGVNPIVAWQDDSGADWEIYVREWDPATSTWIEKGTGAAANGGISDNAKGSWVPALALLPTGRPLAAWEDNNGPDPTREIYVRQWAVSSRPTSVDLLPNSDSGVYDDDDVTRFTTGLEFRVEGTVAGAEVKLYDGSGRVIGRAIATGDTTDIITNVPLGDGVYSVTARQKEAGLLQSSDSTPRSVTIDRQAPAAPAVGPDLQAASDTGIYDDDDCTKDNTPTFLVGGIQPGDYWRLYRDGTRVSQWPLRGKDDGVYKTGASETLALQSDGAFMYTVRAVDAAGNESADSPALAVTIDTVAPAKPTAPPDLDAGSDTGVSSTDNVTNDTTPTFNVTDPAPNYFRLYRDGTLVSSPPIQGDDGGVYKTGASETLALQSDGTFNYTVRAVDRAGNESVDSDPLAVTIDTVAARVTSLIPGPYTVVTSATSVIASFDEALDPMTVNENSFRVLDPDGVPVPGAVSYDATRGRATFTPTAPIAQQGEYEVHLIGDRGSSEWTYNPATGTEYKLLSPMTWWQADNEAFNLGAHLVTVTDAAEQAWLAETLLRPSGTRTAFIGFNDRLIEGSWEWTNNEPVGYRNWATGEPDGLWSENVAVMDDSIGYKWRDVFEALPLPAIVERRPRETDIRDLAGNSLDGEYPGSVPCFPSGDGVAGGDFVSEFSIPIAGAWIGMGRRSARDGGLSNNESSSDTPAIVRDGNGNPIVAWSDNGDTEGDHEIYVKRWDPQANDGLGGWVEMGADSATGGGVSNNEGDSVEPALAVGPDGNPLLAWTDDSDGDFEIYVRRWDGTAWVEVLPGSATGGGISGNDGDSQDPSIVIDASGEVTVAWTDDTDGDSDIYVRSLPGTAENVSDNDSESREPALALTPDGKLVVAWADDYDIYVSIRNGPALTPWSAKERVSDNARFGMEPAVGVDGTGKVWVVWTDARDGDFDIYARSRNGAWGAVENVSNNDSQSLAPALAIRGDGKPIVAWENWHDGGSDIYVRRHNGTGWIEMGDGSAASTGISDSGWSEAPAITLAADGKPIVAWADDNDGDTEIYVRRYSPPDIFGPRVTSTTPATGAVAIRPEWVEVQFNEKVALVNGADTAFRVSSNRGADGQWGTLDDTYVSAASVVFSTDSARFTPSVTPLPYGRYAIFLDGEKIADLSRNLLDGDFDEDTPDGDFVAEFDVGVILGAGGAASAAYRDADPVPSADYTDADGDVFRLTYAGPGSATVTFTERTALGADVNAITFTGASGGTTGTTLKNRLVEQHGAGVTNIATIQATGQSVAGLNLSDGGSTLGDTAIQGNVTVGGTLDDLKALSLAGLLDVGQDITSVALTGDLTGDIDAGQDLRALSVTGAIAATSTIQAGRDMTSVTTGADLSGVLTAGRDIGTITVGAKLLGDLTAGRDIGTVTVGGKLSGDVTAGRNIGTVTAASMDPDITAQTGSITEVRTTAGDLVAVIQAGQGIIKVISARDLSGTITASGDVGTVTATGKLSADVLAGGSIGTVTAASMDPDIEAQNGSIGTVSTTSGDLVADVRAGQGITTVSSARDLSGSISAGGDIGAVTATGKLSADVLAGGGIGTVTAASMDPQIQAQNGSIGAVSTTSGDLVADIQAGQGITTVSSARDISGSISAGGDIGAVTATGKLSADVLAGGSIGTVTAASMDPDIEAQNGSIRTVSTTSGDLVADIRAKLGISTVNSARDVQGTITSTAGSIGALSGRNLSATVNAALDITTLTASGNLTGNVTSGRDLTTLNVGGNLTGNVTVGRHVTTLDVKGNVAGDVVISGNLTTFSGGDTSHDVTGRVLVGGNISTATIGRDLAGLMVAAGNITTATIGRDLGGLLLAGFNLGANRALGGGDDTATPGRTIGNVTLGQNVLATAAIAATGAINNGATVTARGNMAGDLVAGVTSPGPDLDFGTDADNTFVNDASASFRALSVTGALTGNVLSAAGITSVTASSMANAAIKAGLGGVAGAIGTVTTTVGDLVATIQAAENITTVNSAKDLRGSITAGGDIGAVKATGRIGGEWDDDFVDNFQDGLINNGLWVYGGSQRGIPDGGNQWTYSHEEVLGSTGVDDYLSARVQGPVSGNSYGTEAWIRTAYDFNDRKFHTINFTWEAKVGIPGHVNIYLVQVTDGYTPVTNDIFWFRQPVEGTTDLLWGQDSNGNPERGKSYDSGNPKQTWSVKLDPAGVASLYDGPDATGKLLHQGTLDAAKPWYIRLMVSDATSSGFPAGDTRLNLYSVASEATQPAYLRASGSVDSVRAASINAVVEAQGGDVGLVAATSKTGDLAGAVIAGKGISSVTSRQDIRARITAGEDIRTVTATRDILIAGSITAGAEPGNPNGADGRPGTPDDGLSNTPYDITKITAGRHITVTDGIRASGSLRNVRASQGNLTGDLVAGVDIARVYAGQNLTGDIWAGRDIVLVKVVKKLTGSIEAKRNIGVIDTGSMDPVIVAQTGRIGTVRTRKAELVADIYAAQGIKTVSSAGDLQGSVISGTGIGTVSARRSIRAQIQALGGDVKRVSARGDLIGDVLATGDIGSVKAASIDGTILERSTDVRDQNTSALLPSKAAAKTRAAQARRA